MPSSGVRSPWIKSRGSNKWTDGWKDDRLFFKMFMQAFFKTYLKVKNFGLFGLEIQFVRGSEGFKFFWQIWTFIIEVFNKILKCFLFGLILFNFIKRITLCTFIKFIFKLKNYQIFGLTQWYIWELNVRLVPAAIQWALFQKVNLCASKILACFRSLFFRDGYFGYSKHVLVVKKMCIFKVILKSKKNPHNIIKSYHILHFPVLANHSSEEKAEVLWCLVWYT